MEFLSYPIFVPETICCMTIVMTLLLHLTTAGWAAIAVIVLSVFLGLRVTKRISPKEKSGCLGTGYIVLVAFCLITLSVTLTGVLGGFFINLTSLPRYQAKVTGSTSYTDRDDKNRTRTMYRSTVTFVLQDGTPVTTDTDLSSSSPEKPGTTLTVGYRPGMSRAEEFSTAKYLLMGGAGVMLVLLWYVTIGGILYAFGGKVKAYAAFGLKGLLYVIFPLAMLFLFCGMGYAVVEYFMGRRPDMPVWAVVICTFFCVMLLLGGWGYMRSLIRKPRTTAP